MQKLGPNASRCFFSTHLVTIWGQFGWIGVPGPACTVLGPPLGPKGGSQSQFGEDVSNEIVGQEFIPGFPGSTQSTQSSGSGSGGAVQDLPSSRAGGQDDVSSQANSLKSSLQSPNILASQDVGAPPMLAKPGTQTDPKSQQFFINRVAMAPF